MNKNDENSYCAHENSFGIQNVFSCCPKQLPLDWFSPYAFEELGKGDRLDLGGDWRKSCRSVEKIGGKWQLKRTPTTQSKPDPLRAALERTWSSMEDILRDADRLPGECMAVDESEYRAIMDEINKALEHKAPQTQKKEKEKCRH